MATPTVFKVPSPEQLEINKAEKITRMSDTINNVDSGHTLAHPDILERVTWQKTSNGHLLVAKSSLEEIGRSSADNADPAGSPPLAEPVILAMVCKVLRDGTFVYPDGGFPSEYTCSLTDAKLTLALGPASDGEWAEEFKNSVLNLEELLAQVSDDRRHRVGFKAKGGNIIKLKHSVFQVR